ncbi:MAG: hypothetical protein WB783_05910 [Arenicellales bacterium]
MSKLRLCRSLFVFELTAILSGCAAAIHVIPPPDATHIVVQDGGGKTVYEGDGGTGFRMNEDAVKNLPTNDLTIITTRSATKEGKVVTSTASETVKVSPPNIFGMGGTEMIKWNEDKGKYETVEEGGMPETDKPEIHLQLSTAGDNVKATNAGPANAGGESVVQYVGPTAGPLGKQEHVTITDSAGNTLYDDAPTSDKSYALPRPADGKIFVTTHWTKRELPTRQEIVYPEKAGESSGQVSLQWDPKQRLYKASSAAKPAAPTESAKPASGNATKGRQVGQAAGMSGGTQATGGLPAPAEYARNLSTVQNPPVSAAVTLESGLSVVGRGGYAGPARPSGEYFVYPSGESGKIHITTTFKDGSQASQTLSYSEDDVDWEDPLGPPYVPFWWNPATRQFELGYPSREDRVNFVAGYEFPKVSGEIRARSLTLAVGGYQEDIKGAKTGVYPKPGDPPVLEGPTSLSAAGFELRSTLLTGWKKSYWDLGFVSGGGRASVEVPVDVNAGYAYWGGPSSTGTNGAAATGGWLVTNHTTYSNAHVGLWLPRWLSCYENIRFGPTARVDYTELNNYGLVWYMALPNVYSRTTENTTEYSFSAGLKAEGNYPLNNKWLLAYGGELTANYTTADLGASQHSQSPGTDILRNVDDSWSDLGFGASLQGSISYSINHASQASLELGYGYRDASATVEQFNPQNGPTRLISSSREESRILLTYQYSF